MKIIEILNFHRELLNRLYNSGVRLEDARYIDLYVDYSRMRVEGDKMSYIVARLADEYTISERKVYSLIKHFNSDCNTFAV